MLKNKRIVITGSSRGIGKAIARACVRNGAIVGLNYFCSHDSAEALQRERPDKYRLMKFDVSDQEVVKTELRKFVDEEGSIDCLVNNAGILRTGLFAKLSMNDIRRQIEVNLLGPVICSQSALPFMLKQKSGVILNISSVASQIPDCGQAVYAATKGGIESLTRALAVEYARRNIRVVAIRPGPVDTQMLRTAMGQNMDNVVSHLPLSKVGNVEDIAEMALYLLSEKARFATGSIFTVDGGYLCL